MHPPSCGEERQKRTAECAQARAFPSASAVVSRSVPGLLVNPSKPPECGRTLYSTFSRTFAISAAEKARKVWVRMKPSLAALMESAVADVSSGASMIDTAS